MKIIINIWLWQNYQVNSISLSPHFLDTLLVASVNIAALTCFVEVTTTDEGSGESELIEEEEEESTEVCGTDEVTYPSMCDLIQTSTDLKILHPGSCDNMECTSGKVKELNILYFFL